MELFSRSQGDGPPVVLLHGLFGSQDNLGGLARPLAATHRVIGIDLRNHGRSPHGGDMALAKLAADVAETLDALGLDEPVALVGHSLGGKVAMELALTRPDRVRGLVVLDIAPVTYAHRHDTELDALRALDTAGLRTRSEADDALAESIPSPAIRQFLLKNLVRAGDGFAWRIPLDTIADCYPQIAAAPSGGRYDGPTLLLRGGTSDYVRADHEPAIHQRFPAARIETIDGAAHWLHVEAPDTVAQWINQFLDARA